jgi:hypothetical protein
VVVMPTKKGSNEEESPRCQCLLCYTCNKSELKAKKKKNSGHTLHTHIWFVLHLHPVIMWASFVVRGGGVVDDVGNFGTC